MLRFFGDNLLRKRSQANLSIGVALFDVSLHRKAGILAPIGNHSFRATGTTAYLANGGTLEHAQSMAAHESPRTTKLYDRTKERLTQTRSSGL